MTFLVVSGGGSRSPRRYTRRPNVSERGKQPVKSSRLGLLEAFLLFIVFLFLADTALQYAVSASIEERASREVLSRTAALVEYEVASIRKSTEDSLRHATTSSARGTFRFSDFRSANAFFMDHMEANPHITSINYGDPAGNGYLILLESGRWRNRISKGGSKGIVTWFFIDNNGKVLSQEQRKDDYDPRVRPWYTDAAGSPGIHWSRPYIFRTTRDIGITASMAIDRGKNGATGVIGADVMLKDLSLFMSRLKSGNPDLSINLVSRKGEILASSDVDNFLGLLRKGSNALPRISDGVYRDLSAAFRALESAGTDFLSFASSGKYFYAVRRPFSFTRDPQYYMVLTVPQQSLLSFLGSANKIRLFLYLIIIVVSGFFFARRYLAPIRKLTRAVRTFGTDAYEPPSLGGRKDEVGLLASEFSGMAEDLAARQRELKSLIDNVPGIVYRGYRDWSISFIGAEVEPVTGHAPGEFTGGTVKWKEIIHPDDLERVKETFRTATKGGSGTICVEYRILHKDGGIRWVEDRRQMICKDDGALENVDGLLLDITARRRMEEDRKHLSLAVEQSAETIVVTDREGTILYVNPAFERTTGYSVEEAIGKNPRVLKSGKHDESFYREMRMTLLRGETWTGHFINRKKNGSLYEEDATISPVRDSMGDIVNFVAVKRDVTKMVSLEKQVRTAQKMESVGTLAGGIAHDFNNVLTVIVGFGEMLKLRIANDPKAVSDLDEILRGAERASVLTRQLLTFARRQVVDPVRLDLNEVADGFGKLLRKVTREDIGIKIILAAIPVTIRADRGQIEQVLMNLCLNARDAMPGGGQLLIESGTASLEEGSMKEYPYMKSGRYALLSVSDTGIGMDEKTRERVFEPFFTTKGPDKGTGLGLAVVYGIVKQNNGFIHLYSEPGKGSTFRIYFPTVDAPADDKVVAPKGVALGGSETILLAEDNESVRHLAEQTLVSYGYRVLTACDGEEAIGIFLRHQKEIAIAVLDVVMPKKGGKQAYDEMAILSPGLKVLFLSGYSVNAIHESFVLLPGLSFLQKPFGPDAMAKKVRDVLDRK
jgi:PAS domain S-box-containing protein